MCFSIFSHCVYLHMDKAVHSILNQDILFPGQCIGVTMYHEEFCGHQLPLHTCMGHHIWGYIFLPSWYDVNVNITGIELPYIFILQEILAWLSYWLLSSRFKYAVSCIGIELVSKVTSNYDDKGHQLNWIFFRKFYLALKSISIFHGLSDLQY